MYNLKFGVPCSKIKYGITDVDVNCTCEEEAMGIAAGCILMGKKPSVYMQNSGLCRTIDIATSLYEPYGIPLPDLLLSVRYKPRHHEYIGNYTYTLLYGILNWRNVEIVDEE